MTEFPGLKKQAWPRESSELEAFYGGDPRSAGWEAKNLVDVPVPWEIHFGNKPVKSIRIHKKCAESLGRILNAIWDHYGHDQAKIKAGHLDEFGGSFNIRENRNNPSKLSVHSYGAALDLAPDENPNGRPWNDGGEMMPRPAIDAFLAEGWSWGGQFSGTKDAMHFQATFNIHDADAPGAPGGRPVLRKGSTGAAVSELQRRLGVAPDGLFGKQTETAVTAFQQAHGMRVDGVVGNETWAALDAGKPVPPPPTKPVSLFEAKAPKIMADLMRDFGLTDIQAAGILGNIGQECGGFTLWQEAHPISGAGGYGWCQWTGPRRTTFFDWCKEQGLSVQTDAGNYGYLKHELETSEKKAIPAVKATSTLPDAVHAFERAFERAGIPMYEKRIAYGAQALAAYRDQQQHRGPEPVPGQEPEQQHNLLQLLILVLSMLSKEKTMADDPAKPGQGTDPLGALLPLLLHSTLSGKPMNTADLLSALLTGKPPGTPAPTPLPAPAPVPAPSPPVPGDLATLLLPILYERLTGKTWPGAGTPEPGKPADTPTPAPQPPPTQPQGGLGLLKMVTDLFQHARQTVAPGAAAPSTTAPAQDPIRQVIELLTAVSGSGQPPKLGQVNGALGQTIGNLLDGKKTAIGIGGSLLTTILQATGPSMPLSNIIPLIGAGAPGLGSVALPIFLATTAWGFLGKMEKWAGASPSQPPK